MIGRKSELQRLEDMYNSSRFEFLVIYGRRRVGKTTILQEFAHKHNVIFFSAQEKNDALNLTDFSRIIQFHFDRHFIASFPGWEEAFGYITGQSSSDRDTNRKTVIIIDEFPFVAKQNPSVKSILQHTIDHDWKNRNILLILCGSSVSFMLNEVMGYESPLYGRATSTMEVLPFDYLESAAFFPQYSAVEKAIAYGILGGIPRYLSEFSDQLSIRKNIRDRILTPGAFLYDEPSAMLHMELREPGVYASILEAIANGHNKIHEISDAIHEDNAKVSKYIGTLSALRLVQKYAPCGEPKNSKKVLYYITDQYFRFWYRYVFTNKSYYELLGPEDASREIEENLNDFMGPIFETICTQYLKRQARMRKLPFIPYQIGKWWGNNPCLRAQDDVDVLAINRKGDEAIFCECKFTNRPMPMEEYDDLQNAAKAFPHIQKKHFIFISKSGFTEPVTQRAITEDTTLLTIEDLYP
ncbi:MAG: ATP-binding protein [Bilifractor sp.]